MPETEPKQSLIDQVRALDATSIVGSASEVIDQDPKLVIELLGVVEKIRTRLEKHVLKVSPIEVIAKDFGLNSEEFRTSAGSHHVGVKGIFSKVSKNPSLKKLVQEISGKSGLDLLGDRSIKDPLIIKLDEVITPADKVSTPAVRQGEGKQGKELKNLPRYELLKETLSELGIKNLDYYSYEGVVATDMRRKEPYIQVIIPKLNKIVQLCAEEGNITFIVHSIQDAKALRRQTKNDLKKRAGSGEVTYVRWNGIDQQSWKENLKNHLLLKEGFLARDREYYSTHQNVLYDLRAIAKKSHGSEDKIEEINQASLDRTYITCSSGEEVHARTYCYQAGMALGIAPKSREAISRVAEALAVLKWIAGVEVKDRKERDRKYYSTPEIVRADLESFAKASNAKKSLDEVALSKLRPKKASCTNGDEITFSTYLKHAGMALGIFDLSEKKHRDYDAHIFEVLKWIAGVPVYEKRDEKYFKKLENLDYDLKAFAAALSKKTGKEKTPENLFGNVATLEIRCATGEKVKGAKYLNEAGIAFGIVKNNKETNSNRSIIINRLKQMVGYEWDYLKLRGKSKTKS